jgi:hypothetical protein
LAEYAPLTLAVHSGGKSVHGWFYVAGKSDDYSTTFRDLPTLATGSPNGTSELPQVFVEFLSPAQLNAYQPPPDLVLGGDNHLVRGSVFVLGGPPGVGKSRATVALAQAGATRSDWFGLCKNNDGELGPRSVWERRNGRFGPVRDFDWQAFDFPEAGKEAGISQAQVAAVFQDGQLKLPRSVAVKRLQELTGRKKTLCYEALRDDGLDRY